VNMEFSLLDYWDMLFQLSFLTLMMCLETLFHPAQEGELKYRISRNTAALLGKKLDKYSDTIFKDINHLYQIRSKLIHTGENIIKEIDLNLLRFYVKESIKEIYQMQIDKGELLELLNSRGFSN